MITLCGGERSEPLKDIGLLSGAPGGRVGKHHLHSWTMAGTGQDHRGI